MTSPTGVDVGDHPDALACVDRRDSAIVGSDRRSEFGLRIGVFGQGVLVPGPARDEIVAQHARREPLCPRQMTDDVVHPGAGGVGFAGRHQRAASGVGGQRLHRRGQAGAQPGSAGPGGQHRGEAARRCDSPGCQHRHRHGVQHRVEQRQCADGRVPVAATFTAARHHQVDAGVLRPARLFTVVNLCGGSDSGVVDTTHPGQVGAEADRYQHRLRGQRGVEEARFFAHHPVHQANSERPSHMRQFGVQ